MDSTAVEEKISTAEEEETLEWLTEREKCDACGAQSYYAVAFKAGLLYFCRHHYLKHEDLFFDEAEDIVDESELLR
jgi:hypothetical protein